MRALRIVWKRTRTFGHAKHKGTRLAGLLSLQSSLPPVNSSSCDERLLSGSPGPISGLRSEMLALSLNLSLCKICQYFMHMRAKSICEFWMTIEKGVMTPFFLVRNETERIPLSDFLCAGAFEDNR